MPAIFTDTDESRWFRDAQDEEPLSTSHPAMKRALAEYREIAAEQEAAARLDAAA